MAVRDTLPLMEETELVPRLRQRRDTLARELGLANGVVVVPSGLPLPIAGTDQVHDYHAHNEHYYLSGVSEPGSVLAFDPGEGWSLFVQQLSREDQVWTNASPALEELAARSGIEAARVLEATHLQQWLEKRRGEPVALAGNHDIEHRAAEYGIPNWAALELEVDDERSALVSQAIGEARRAKDPLELDRMRRASKASIAGHMTALRIAVPGMSERRLQVELEADFFRAGAARTAYGSIVGTGPNGSVLHFAPGERQLSDGDIVLIDAAGEVDGYAADITRTFPVSGRFSPEQAELYDLVLAVQGEAIAGVRPGVEFKDLHLQAAHGIAQGLVDAGILVGNAEDLVESDAHALFFPHGLGHMLGLATHDSGGCLAGREPSDRFGLKYLRADLPLQEGYVVTIEPGIYFIRALLTDPDRRHRYRQAVNWDRVDSMLDFGGIRIEDDVLVTASGAEVLSAALPSSRRDIEELRREARSA